MCMRNKNNNNNSTCGSRWKEYISDSIYWLTNGRIIIWSARKGINLDWNVSMREIRWKYFNVDDIKRWTFYCSSNYTSIKSRCKHYLRRWLTLERKSFHDRSWCLNWTSTSLPITGSTMALCGAASTTRLQRGRKNYSHNDASGVLKI